MTTTPPTTPPAVPPNSPPPTSPPPNSRPATVRAEVVRGDVTRLDVDVELGAGTVTAVIGPNGAGKTTLLQAVAGLIPMRGQVHLGGRDVSDLAPAGRRVGYVPQEGALFPHLTVVDNVAFGPRASGARRSSARRAALAQLADLEIDELADRYPRTLSGGQAQRVALARALVTSPDALLLDEPTASLDAAGRADVQSLLIHRLSTFAGITLLVTHDAAEALTLADRVLVLHDGRVVQDASPAELVAAPASRWVAALLNLNSWPGTAHGTHQVTLDAGGTLEVADPLPAGPVLVSVAPTSVTLSPQAPQGSARNTWPLTVAEVHSLGDRVRVSLRPAAGAPGPSLLVAEITTASSAELGIAAGGTVWASVKATEVVIAPE